MRRVVAWARFAVLSTASCAGASVAYAHAPQARRVALTSDGAAIAVSMPGFGVLVRSAASQPFAYVCDAALDQQPSDAVPSLAFLADGSLLIGSMDGVRIVAPDSCPRPHAASNLSAASVVALAAHVDGQVAYAATAGDLPGVWRSADAGRSWQRQSSLPGAALVSALLISPDDPDTLYLSQGTAPERSSLLVSTDAGASFSSFDHDRALTLLHVQGGDSERLWALARSADNTTNRGFDVLRAQRPQGPWQSMLRVNYFGGFTIDPHGVVWVGDEGGGVHRSRDGGDSFANVAPDRAVACLVAAGDALWACTPGTALQPALMMQREADASFRAVVAFADVDQLVDCAAEVDVPSRCAAAWVEWRRDVRMESLGAQDAGAPGSGADAGSDAAVVVQPITPAADGGCSVHAGLGARPPMIPRMWPVPVLVLLAARRRSARASRPARVLTARAG